jgi:hypothetical protein
MCLRCPCAPALVLQLDEKEFREVIGILKEAQEDLAEGK